MRASNSSSDDAKKKKPQSGKKSHELFKNAVTHAASAGGNNVKVKSTCESNRTNTATANSAGRSLLPGSIDRAALTSMKNAKTMKETSIPTIAYRDIAERPGMKNRNPMNKPTSNVKRDATTVILPATTRAKQIRASAINIVPRVAFVSSTMGVAAST